MRNPACRAPLNSLRESDHLIHMWFVKQVQSCKLICDTCGNDRFILTDLIGFTISTAQLRFMLKG